MVLRFDASPSKNATSIEGVKCLRDVSNLSDPAETGISIVTQPGVGSRFFSAEPITSY
jgi:hypothetical protein